jgi:hypothetical protein
MATHHYTLPAPPPSSQQQQQQTVDAWNTHHPSGTAVNVHQDDGTIFNTTTRGRAWLLGGHTAVISVTGIAGAYLLERVTPVQ